MSGDRRPSQPSGASSDAAKPQQQEEPAAGPHAKPHLTDHERTPGAGTLPDAESDDEVGDGASS